MFNLCPPALIYFVFSLTQILIDTFKGLYNTAMMKFIVMIMITILLNVLCINGLGIISWIIVFVPFILMTVIVSLLLWVFGLDAATGKLNYNCDVSGNKCGENISKDISGNIIIYDPYYDEKVRPVVYRPPNIIIPRVNERINYIDNNINTPLDSIGRPPPAMYGIYRNSDPEYH